jgi:hypothetical protein
MFDLGRGGGWWFALQGNLKSEELGSLGLATRQIHKSQGSFLFLGNTSIPFQSKVSNITALLRKSLEILLLTQFVDSTRLDRISFPS